MFALFVKSAVVSHKTNPFVQKRCAVSKATPQCVGAGGPEDPKTVVFDFIGTVQHACNLSFVLWGQHSIVAFFMKCCVVSIKPSSCAKIVVKGFHGQDLKAVAKTRKTVGSWF